MPSRAWCNPVRSLGRPGRTASFRGPGMLGPFETYTCLCGSTGSPQYFACSVSIRNIREVERTDSSYNF